MTEPQPNNGQDEAEAALAAGIEHYKGGRLDQAAQTLEGASRALQHDVRARSYLGAAYYSLRRYHEAAEQFRHAAALRGSDPRVLFNLGNAYLGCGLLTPARDAFKAALQADPNYVAALFPLACLERLLRPHPPDRR